LRRYEKLKKRNESEKVGRPRPQVKARPARKPQFVSRTGHSQIGVGRLVIDGDEIDAVQYEIAVTSLRHGIVLIPAGLKDKLEQAKEVILRIGIDCSLAIKLKSKDGGWTEFETLTRRIELPATSASAVWMLAYLSRSSVSKNKASGS